MRALLTALLSLVLVASPAGGAIAAPEHRGPGDVFAIGDSVMLGAERCMKARGYRVDARGSRQVTAVAQVLHSKTALPPRVIVHTGTNGGADRAELNRVMHVIGAHREVIWVTVQLPDDTGRYTFEDATNRAIRALPARYPNAFVADWNALSDRHPGWTWGDGIHLTPDGCRGYARMLSHELHKVDLATEHYVPMGPLLPT